MQNLIGYRLRNDIYTDSGFFLLAADTVLKKEHINKLTQFDVTLSASDVALSSDVADRLIKDSIAKIVEIFQSVSFTKFIPLYEIRKDLLPAIFTLTANQNLFNLINDLQQKDEYIYTHNLAVAVYASSFGKWLNFSESDIQTLTIAALLHDIGKTKVPSDILHKPGKLTAREYNLVKAHTILGYELIKNTVGASDKIALVALQHHEREDGSGYPLQLNGNEIDPFSKIIAICDIFHAMTSNREYREAIPFHMALKEMWSDSFGKLDAKLMNVFVKKIMETSIGNNVLLSDGSIGQVIMLNPYEPIYPLVKLQNVNRNIIDLSTQRSLYIEKVL